MSSKKAIPALKFRTKEKKNGQNMTNEEMVDSITVALQLRSPNISFMMKVHLL